MVSQAVYYPHVDCPLYQTLDGLITVYREKAVQFEALRDALPRKLSLSAHYALADLIKHYVLL